MPDHVNSAGDNRAVNNTVRHSYRILNDEEKAAMQAIKDAGEHFLNTMTSHCGRSPDGRYPSRELSLAQTKIEEAVMWAVKHVTA